jgi:hypothetical protein
MYSGAAAATIRPTTHERGVTMPFLGRRMARAAVVGGVAYHAGSVRAESRQREAEQEARLQDLEAQQYQQQAPPPPVAAAPAAETDYTEELAQLAKLHEQGILTDDEFAAKKKEILGI